MLTVTIITFFSKFETLNPFKRKKEVVEIEIEKQNFKCSILQGLVYLYVQIETLASFCHSHIFIYTSFAKFLLQSYSFE